MKRFYFIEKEQSGELVEGFHFAKSLTLAKKDLDYKNIIFIKNAEIDNNLISRVREDLTSLKSDENDIEYNSLINYLLQHL